MNNTLSDWTSTSVCAVYYFHHPVATVSNTLKLNIKALQTVRFRLTVSDPNSPPYRYIQRSSVRKVRFLEVK